MEKRQWWQQAFRWVYHTLKASQWCFQYITLQGVREINSIGHLLHNKIWRSLGNTLMYINVKGWLNRLNFKGKTNQLKVPLQNAYFYYFGQFRIFPFISDRNSIILFKFTWKLPCNAPPQNPLIVHGSLSADRDQQFVITGQYIFLFVCVSIKHWCIISQCLVA